MSADDKVHPPEEPEKPPASLDSDLQEAEEESRRAAAEGVNSATPLDNGSLDSEQPNLDDVLSPRPDVSELQQPTSLEIREQARLTIEEIRNQARSQIESATYVDPSKAAQTGRDELRRIDNSIRSGDWRKVTERDLGNFISLVCDVILAVGEPLITEVVDKITDDQDCLNTFYRLAEFADDIRQSGQSASEDEIIPSSSADPLLLGGMLFAGALLLAAGATVPVFLGATAEIILTNEVAAAAVVLSGAALIKTIHSS